MNIVMASVRCHSVLFVIYFVTDGAIGLVLINALPNFLFRTFTHKSPKMTPKLVHLSSDPTKVSIKIFMT